MLNNFIKPIRTLDDRQERIIVREKGVSFGDLVAQRLALPGLVGCWPMSSVQRSTGNVYDLSGQDRTLTYNGNPTFNYTSLGVTYCDMDGTGDYLSLADSTDLRVTGGETIFNSAVLGMTAYAWVKFDTFTAGGNEGIITRYGASAATSAFALATYNPAGEQSIYAQIYNGSSFYSAVAPNNSASTGAWLHVVIRFIPSVSLSVVINGVFTTNTTSIPCTTTSIIISS